MTNSLLELARAVKSCEETFSRKVILFGNPGSGKTHIAATIAKVPSIKRVFWFDVENGIETLIYAKTSQGQPLLTDEEMSKIIPIRIRDTAELPRAAETILKAFTSTKGVILNSKEGKVDPKGDIPFNLFTLTDEDVVVIDTLGQVADSVVALVKNQHSDIQSIQRIFGIVNPDLGAILSGIQATKANVIACTHVLDITKDVTVGKNQVEQKLLRSVPMCGSRPFSDRVGKFFGYKIYTYVNGSTFRATVKPDKISKVLVSSRRPISFEGDVDPSLEKLFLSEEEAMKEKAEQSAKIIAGKPAIHIKSK